MSITSSLIGLALSLTGITDEQYQEAIQKALGGVAPEQMMVQHLSDISYANLEKRSVRYEALKTVEDIRAYQQEQYDYFVTALGGFPERTPLNARIVGDGVGEGFRYEKLIYESRPNFFVTAVLYLPVTEGPYPAVLVPCGHSNNGKAEAAYQRACILLAQHGIAALCYDPIGQGERIHYVKENGKQLFGSTVEHTLFDVGAILTGTSIAQYRIWDGMRSIDYLQSRPDIITDKIGCTGNSGGGTLTSYIMAMDERVAVAAPSCYLTSWKRLLETIGPQDGEQNVFGQLKQGFDMADFIHVRAPKPTLLLTATRDFFDIQGSWDSFREAKRLYTRLGAPERISLVETDKTHGFTKRLREGMVQWMQRWLLEIDRPVEEIDFAVLSDAELQCTPTGQVSALEGSRSTLDLNVERAEGLKAKRAAYWKDTPPQEILQKIRDLAGIRPEGTLAALSAEILGESEYGEHRVHDLLLTPEPGVVLVARAYLPKAGDDAARAHIFTANAGLDGLQAVVDGGLAANEAYLFVSLRGMGLTEVTGGGDWAKTSSDWSAYYRAYLNGLSFVGMRTEDLRQVTAWWRACTKAPISLTALGESTVPALHAAALQPDAYTHVTLQGGIPTWQAVVESPRPNDQLINTVHNALSFYDLDNLQGLIAPDKLTISHPKVPVF